MQIFCFDMMMILCKERGIRPGFLVHDSHIFDGVDERQIAKALEFTAKEVEKLGYQYIITLNSDTLPDNSLHNINLDNYILPVILTDETEEGGLFGFRF
jgi:uncharacterized protein YydD (DUF2326 family)